MQGVCHFMNNSIGHMLFKPVAQQPHNRQAWFSSSIAQHGRLDGSPSLKSICILLIISMTERNWSMKCVLLLLFPHLLKLFRSSLQ